MQNNTFDFSLTRARGVTHDFVIRPKASDHRKAASRLWGSVHGIPGNGRVRSTHEPSHLSILILLLHLCHRHYFQAFDSQTSC